MLALYMDGPAHGFPKEQIQTHGLITIFVINQLLLYQTFASGGVRQVIIRKQPPRGVPRKRCSENMQQIYRRTPMPKCDFNKVASNFIEIALPHGC